MRGLKGTHTPDPDPDFETTLDLLRRAQAGDADALNSLIGRYLPRMRRWAAGRLPTQARGMTDTQDLVQETVSRAFRNVAAFEIRGEGSLQAYLRQALLNQIRQEIRRAATRLPASAVDLTDADHVEAPGPSPLEAALGAEAIERYERALERLRAEDREAIVARVELGLSHKEVAEVLGKSSANAARMAVERAVSRLLKEMEKG